MTNDSNNLDLWKAWKDVPEHQCKAFDKGTYKGTSWDPTWAMQEATRLWGPFGKDWGIRNTQWTAVGSPIDAIIMTAEFYYPSGCFDMAVDHPYIRGRETMKILQTDLVKKALTKLGAAEEIYLGKFDSDAYAIIKDDPKGRDMRKFCSDAIDMIKTAPADQLNEIVHKCRTYGATGFYFTEVTQAEYARRVELEQEDSTEQMDARFDGQEETDGSTEAKKTP